MLDIDLSVLIKVNFALFERNVSLKKYYLPSEAVTPRCSVKKGVLKTFTKLREKETPV